MCLDWWSLVRGLLCAPPSPCLFCGTPGELTGDHTAAMKVMGFPHLKQPETAGSGGGPR